MHTRHRISRRRLLQLAGGATVLAFTDTLRWTAGAAQPATIHQRWSFPLELQPGERFETPELVADTGFNAVHVAWRSAAADAWVEVATSDAAGVWSDWTHLHSDSHDEPDEQGWRNSALLLAIGSVLRARITNESAVPIVELVVSAIDTRAGAELQQAQGQPPLIDGFIISRAGWGADESWRHVDQDPSKPIAITPRYVPVEKVVVHHTETAFGWDDPAAVVRSVYYYHAVIQGWGDIGYNFLIDFAGNVYEGRYGGPNVVGAHALQYNRGSLAIAMVGSYMQTAPSDAAIAALERLIRARAGHIDMADAYDWVDLGDVPNLCGHGDLLDTACPGTTMHGLLPILRGRLTGGDPIYYARPIPLELPEIVSFAVTPRQVSPGGVVEVRATVRNSGKRTLQSQGPEPGFTYGELEDYESVGHPKLDGHYRLVIGTSVDSALANPYRWGFGGALARDEAREVVGYLQLGDDIGARTLTAGVIKEFVQYYEEGLFPTTVGVVHPLVAEAAPNGEPGARYFPETGHNVPAAFAAYWEAQGGLRRFGYPLTEAFIERSVTDGVEYMTQYFERARFEYHPEYAGTHSEVLLGLLGVERTLARVDETPFQPIPYFDDQSDFIYFPETSHSLSYRFLEHWRANGGLPIFGYPISEKFEERSPTDGRLYLVQYFERNRFEYHPEVADYNQQILLGHLAREILIDRGWLPPG
jgi:hypothetical protein